MFIPEQKGVYILVIYLSVCRTLRIGKLGRFSFVPGYYTYTGSALGGLKARIDRHIRKKKKVRWHIDYVLPVSSIVMVITIPTSENLECRINNALMSRKDSMIPIDGFGSSDCGCPAHLLYWGISEPRHLDVFLEKGIGIPVGLYSPGDDQTIKD